MRLNAQTSRFLPSALAAAVLLGTSQLSQAAPLDLVLNDAPDFVVSFMDVVYDAGTDLLIADGFVFQLDTTNDDNAADDLANGKIDVNATFDLDAVIDDAGNLSSGSVLIEGTIPDLGINTETVLLEGELTNFGFSEVAGMFEFLFNVGTSAAAVGFGPIGGIILSDSSLANPNFTSNFNNNFGIPGFGQATGDVASFGPTTQASEPASLALLLGGSVLLAATARRRVR